MSFLIACQDVDKGELIADAYGAKLYSSEIDKLMNENTSFEDSIFIAKEYVDLWVSRQILLAKSETVLTVVERDKSKEMQNYKNDLLVYETLNKIALSKIDTLVTDAQIEEYYALNEKEFQLTQNIIKVNFFRIPDSEEEIESLWNKFKRNQNDIVSLLTEEALKKNWTFYLSDDEWVYFDDILKEIPINTYNQEHFLNNNKYIRIVDGNYVYFVRILDFRTTSNTAPLQVEVNNIKNTILMQRQQEMIKKVETDLLLDAYNSNKVTIH